MSLPSLFDLPRMPMDWRKEEPEEEPTPKPENAPEREAAKELADGLPKPKP